MRRQTVNVQHDALIVFLSLFGVHAVTLVGDYILDKLGLATISQHVWAHPELGIPIMLWQVAAVVALGIHLWFGVVNLRAGRSWGG